MSRHAFLGTNQFSSKYTGDYDAEWEDFRKSIISTVEASMFGFSMVSLGDPVVKPVAERRVNCALFYRPVATLAGPMASPTRTSVRTGFERAPCRR